MVKEIRVRISGGVDYDRTIDEEVFPLINRRGMNWMPNGEGGVIINTEGLNVEARESFRSDLRQISGVELSDLNNVE